MYCGVSSEGICSNQVAINIASIVRRYEYHSNDVYLYSPVFNIILVVATFGILIALIIKRQEAPINFYLLLAFVRHPISTIHLLISILFSPPRLLVRACHWGP